MEGFEKPRRKSLLEHFSEVEDFRANWRVMYPMPEILLLVVCATIAACDDFEDIAGWGKAHIGFLRKFLPYDHGVPGARWLNILMNRINPELFSDCFMAWATSFRPSFSAKQIAVDGKTLRRSHDAQADVKALHLVSAFATHERLVMGQEATAEKSNEITAIPVLLERLASKGALSGALVSIDAMGCNPRVTQSVSGTLVLWEKLDRVVMPESSEQDFLDLMDVVERHLAMVFHRYLDSSLTISINDRPINPWDPFLSNRVMS